MVVNQMQVSEVYSPLRVVKMANRMGLRGGWSLDLTTHDEHGRPWDFNDRTMRNKAIRKLVDDQPLVLIGSPMCTEYIAINRINHCRLTKEEVERRVAYARKHRILHTTICNTVEEWTLFLTRTPSGVRIAGRAINEEIDGTMWSSTCGGGSVPIWFEIEGALGRSTSTQTYRIFHQLSVHR